MSSKDDFNLMDEISKINPIRLEGWMASWEQWRNPSPLGTFLKLSGLVFLVWAYISFLLSPPPEANQPIITPEQRAIQQRIDYEAFERNQRALGDGYDLIKNSGGFTNARGYTNEGY